MNESTYGGAHEGLDCRRNEEAAHAKAHRVDTGDGDLQGAEIARPTFYYYGTPGMTREWLLGDDGTPAEEAVRTMFGAMPETLKQVFFTGGDALADPLCARRPESKDSPVLYEWSSRQ